MCAILLWPFNLNKSNNILFFMREGTLSLRKKIKYSVGKFIEYIER